MKGWDFGGGMEEFGKVGDEGNSGWGSWCGERLPNWRGRAGGGVAELEGVTPSGIGLRFGW